MRQHISDYSARLASALTLPAINKVPELAEAFKQAWDSKNTIYLCGNGGSAGNSIHLANDFIYGAGLARGIGLRIESLSANSAVLTCLANDIGYEEVYAEQLRVKANVGDVLLVFSGSGNSPNIVRALEMGNKLGMETFAILGFSGGKCKDLAKHPLHFEISDMQIAEDLQLIIGHMIMQWLCNSTSS